MHYKINWEMNPVIVKELRSRMRGFRAFAVLTGVLIALAIFSYTIYRMVLVSSQYYSSPLSPLIGQTLFAGLAMLILMIVCAITPALTAGAISGEHEKLTYEMLLATPLHPASILWGKLVSALSYVFLLIFAAIPLASLVFIYGGVSAWEMIKSLVTIIVVAVMFGVIGLFFSALLGRTGRATTISYLVALLFFFGPLLVAAMISVMRQGDPPRWIMILNPISALASAFAPSVNVNNLSGMFWMIGNIPYWIMGPAPISFTSIPRPLYHYSLPIYGAITLITYLLATRLVRPTGRWRIHWSEALVTLVLIIGYIGVVALAFGSTANRYEHVVIVEEVTPTPTPVDLDTSDDGPAILTPVPTVIAPTPTPIAPPAVIYPNISRSSVTDLAP